MPLQTSGDIFIIKGFTIDNTEWDNYRYLFKQQEIPAKTILLKEVKFAKNIFHINQGCLRVCFNNNRKDLTFNVPHFRVLADTIGKDRYLLFLFELTAKGMILVIKRAFFDNFLKLIVEVRQTIEAAGITDFLNRLLLFYYHSASFINSEFYQKFQIGFSCLCFKISAKGFLC